MANVCLEAPLTANGPWSAAHFRNETYDNLSVHGLNPTSIAAISLKDAYRGA